MWSVLHRWLVDAPQRKWAGAAASARHSAQPGDTRDSPPQAAATVTQERLSPQEVLALDCRFSAKLLQLPQCESGPASAAEQAALQQLHALVRLAGHHPLVPRQPATLPKLMHLLRREEVSVRELAEHLATDPALLGEVIRLANSAHYRGTRPLDSEVDSLQTALLLLGHQGMQQLLVRCMMGPVYDARQGRFGRHAMQLLWAQAERSAHACAWMRTGAHDQFDGYLAGMVAHTGLIAAVRLLDLHYDSQKTPASLSFHQALLALSAALSARIAQSWHFPEAVLQVLAARSQGSVSPATAQQCGELGEALRLADRMSKLHLMAWEIGLSADSFAGREQQCWTALDQAFSMADTPPSDPADLPATASER